MDGRAKVYVARKSRTRPSELNANYRRNGLGLTFAGRCFPINERRLPVCLSVISVIGSGITIRSCHIAVGLGLYGGRRGRRCRDRRCTRRARGRAQDRPLPARRRPRPLPRADRAQRASSSRAQSRMLHRRADWRTARARAGQPQTCRRRLRRESTPRTRCSRRASPRP